MKNIMDRFNISKNTLLGIVGFVVAFFVTLIALNFNSIFGNELKDMANELNETMPFMVDDITRADSVSIKGKDTVVYEYTVIGFTTDELKSIFTDEVVDAQKETLVSIAKTNADLEYFRDNKVNLEYIYSSEDNEVVATIEIGYEEYTN